MTGLRPLRAVVGFWQPGTGALRADDALAAVASAWNEVVGADIARRTRPAALRNGSLTVLTMGSAWSHQLSFLAPQILESLRALVPGARLVRLRFAVASGRSRALLLQSRSRRAQDRRAPSTEDAGAQADAADMPAGSASMVEHLRVQQTALDEARAREGWRRCGLCEAWQPPGSPSPCARCADKLQRALDDRIARVLFCAPWLGAADVAAQVPDAIASDFERVRRRLTSGWEDQIRCAQRRLRRSQLEAADRVVAWSYLMLLAGLPQREIGRAVIADVLGREWANALCDENHSNVKREARRGHREKS